MSEIKFNSPILDNLAVNDASPISSHNGISCYAAMDMSTNDKYILKVIRIPASRTQLDAFLLSGAYADEASALVYFKEQAEDLLNETEVLKKLADLEGFFAYEEAQIVPLEDEVGLEVYLLGSYRKTLERTMKKQPMTHLGAVNLGLDMCAALTVCRRSGYLYADLKPSNIFITDDNSYRIGDLGFLNLDALSYTSLPDKYRSAYTAPEIADAFSTLNTSIDIYAVGKILYQIYNNGELPNMDSENPAEALPAPANADYEMSEIILKACAADPAERWEDPAQMGQALVSYMQRNGANDTPIVPPIVPIPEEPVAEQPADTEDESIDTTLTEALDSESVNEPVELLDETSDEIQPEETDATSADSEIAEESEVPSESVTEESQTSTVSDFQDEELQNISVLIQPSGDETAPEYNETDIDYAEVSPEINEILAQADDLVSHPIPEPPVAPDPIFVPIPDPIPVEEPEVSTTPDNTEAEITENNDPAPDADIADANDTADKPAEKTANSEETTVVAVAEPEATDTQVSTDVKEEDPDEETDDEFDDQPVVKKRKLGWLKYSILVLLLLGLVALGAYFYTNYYLVPVNSIAVEGKEDYLTVLVDTAVDESLITVECKGQHGDVLTAPLVDGKAEFNGLTDDTGYVITLQISGLHKLTGETTKAYSTPKLTTITSFEAFTGSTAGSVNIAFTVEGKDSEKWKLTITADGESTRSVTLQSKNDTVNGLAVGKEYTFTLSPVDELYLAGNDTINHTVREPIYAEHLTIDSFTDGTMTVSWLAPDGIDPCDWSIVCTDESGDYHEEQVVKSTENTTKSFTGIDNAKAYTIVVTAAGMQNGTSVAKPANAPSLTNVKLEKTDTGAVLTWECAENLGNWKITYTVDGSQIENEAVTAEKQFVFNFLIPDSKYCVTIKAEDGTTPLGGTKVFFTDEAQKFTYTHNNKTTTVSDMTFKLCAPPNVEPWRYSDKNVNYTTTFAAGQKAGVVIELGKECAKSSMLCTRAFIIYDAEQNIVSASYTQNTWEMMWPNAKHCELTIPSMPTAAGEYKLVVLFNNQLVTEQSFTIS